MKIDLFKKWLNPYATVVRDLALESDRTGKPVNTFVEDSYFKPLHFFKTPSRYWDGITLKDGNKVFGTTALENVIFVEEIAYGDPGLYLSLPGPNLSGTIVDKIGTQEQKDNFFEYFINNNSWSAFALTEPTAGSDVANMLMTAEKGENNTYLLNGQKRYVGNGAIADYMVVFAKKTKKDLPKNKSIFLDAFLINKNNNLSNIKQSVDNTLGLKAARLGKIEFTDYLVTEQDILGHDKSSLKRGIRGAMETFLHMRPATAAIAIGLSKAIIDYVQTCVNHEYNKFILDRLKWEVERGRALTLQAAITCDTGNFNSYYSSMAKQYMNGVVVKVARECSKLMGDYGLIEHPLLEKWLRDARMIEFMEGSTNILKMDIKNKMMNGRF
ncbi:TPA: acyl-CoA/acyl-ACP dehydrogenase [Bacillus toyonensis]|nr:acyl-CoA/acyl-ACP dehydrogenase [Bacillus toyonensis]